MSDHDTLFADDGDVLFAPEEDSETAQPTSDDPTHEAWKVLVVDDEKEIHNVTQLALDNFNFEGKALSLINAYSGQEARKIIECNPDTSMILLDVVMETDHEGLDVVKYIREVLGNGRVRIVLRTGQPGQAPEQLSKFVPQSVQRLIDTNPDAPELEKHDQDVSILFLDIAGYTKISESLQQEKVNYLIERYFSSFLDDIHQNQGDINETAGDGLMIIFQDPDPTTHALQAARTALAIHRKTAQINADLRGTYEPVVVNIGINSGHASVGSSKFEGLTGTRWTYTASGSVTNLAARLAAHATGGSVLVSAETAGRIAGQFKLEDLGCQTFRNVSEPMHVFRLLA
jgi:class 3 adenylate cyclase